MTTIKRSVTIDQEVLKQLSAGRRSNLSATVNESLWLIADLDAQQAVVDRYQADGERFSEAELRPYQQAVLAAQAKAALMRRPVRTSGRKVRSRPRRG